MGVVWGSTDLDTAYGFKLLNPGGFVLRGASVQHITEKIPGQDGVTWFNTELEPREFELNGLISDTSYANILTKLVALETEFMGSLAESPNPTTFIAPQRAVKNLTVPGVTGIFKNCVYNGRFEIQDYGSRVNGLAVTVTIAILQLRPFLSSS